MKAKDFLDFLKLPPNILAAISLVTGIILFAPVTFLKKLYMVVFCDKFGFVISIIFLVSSAILLILLISIIYKMVKEKIENKKLKKAKIKYLLNAEPSKVKLIKEFIKESTHTLQISANNGLTVELLHFGIITLAGNTQSVDFDYNDEMYLRYFLQPWVIILINQNAELMEKYKNK